MEHELIALRLADDTAFALRDLRASAPDLVRVWDAVEDVITAQKEDIHARGESLRESEKELERARSVADELVERLAQIGARLEIIQKMSALDHDMIADTARTVDSAVEYARKMI